MEPYEIAAAAFGVVMLALTTRELLHRRMRPVQYSIWAVIWFALILLGIVPQFYSTLLFATQVLGMYTPIHFVTTFSVLILFGMAYYLGKRVGELDDKLSTVVQHIALQPAAEGVDQGKERKKHPKTQESS